VATPQLAGGNWSAGEPMGTGNLNGAASGAGGAALNTYLTMVVGDGGTIYSRNVLGTTTTPTNPSAPARLNAVAFGTAGWVAVGDGGASVGSVDGETWTAKPTSVTANLYGISPSPLGGYIATGAAGTILLGSTAATWSPATSPGTTNDLRAALYGNARYVAVGAAGTVVTGTDGLTWTVSPSGTTADLRGLAYAGLATLVNGRRLGQGSPYTAIQQPAADLDQIPAALVERVEVVTGGASAIYGADAVSGVVNFIMKKDFEGMTARAQYGAGTGGEPKDVLAALTAGMNFADGRGNISGAIEYTHEGRLGASDRKYLSRGRYARLVQNPDDPNDDPAVPDFVPLTDIRYFGTSREGGIDIDIDGVPDVRPTGQPYDNGSFIPPGGSFARGGDSTYVADYIGDLLARSDRTVASAFAHYDVSDAATVFAEFKFAHSKSLSYDQPTFDYYMAFTPDNPFMPDAVRSAIIPGIGAAVFEDPSVPDFALMVRDNFDLGVRGERNKRDTIRSVVGVEGDVSEHLRYELSYVYGQTKV